MAGQRMCRLVAVLLLIAGVSAGQISFQVHSYDDLGAWPALVAKGVSYFKLDVAFVSASDCPRLRFPHNCSREGGLLLLSHDDPLDHADVAFFTAEDILSLCSSMLTNVTGERHSVCHFFFPS